MIEGWAKIASKLGYYIRPVKHSMTREDWKVFLDFADKHFGKWNPEEDALIDLLTNLIRDYEATAYPPRAKSRPHQMVAFLLEQRDLKPSDLWPIIGSKGRVSEILTGKRSISKEQAKKLAAFFHVRTDLFI